ncbi:MAG: hypothetical protein F6K00_18940 [Leptolyngbya sp. SIOISBB]|nr:hypothetical protein [Leptolyngbya sp. SIOISBB]
MKTVLSSLGWAQNVRQFLQFCEGIVLRREQNAWLSALAPECSRFRISGCPDRTPRLLE